MNRHVAMNNMLLLFITFFCACFGGIAWTQTSFFLLNGQLELLNVFFSPLLLFFYITFTWISWVYAWNCLHGYSRLHVLPLSSLYFGILLWDQYWKDKSAPDSDDLRSLDKAI